jgi:5-methylcytosine-specific restriction endonuclease McrA
MRSQGEAGVQRRCDDWRASKMFAASRFGRLAASVTVRRAARESGPFVVSDPYDRQVTETGVVRPCMGVSLDDRCPEYALAHESRCSDCKARFEAKRRADPNVTGRRGTTAEWRRARGLKLWRQKQKLGHNACQKCRRTDWSLEVHHADGDSSNNAQKNLVILCSVCHREATAELAQNGPSRGIGRLPGSRNLR